MNGGFVLLYMTFGDEAEARRIGAALVRERLVACVNVIAGMHSLYWWDGDVREGEEIVMIAKTRADAAEKVRARVVGLHSYECPCVVEVPLSGGHGPFLDWVAEQTGQRG